jgi:hypothetical protein
MRAALRITRFMEEHLLNLSPGTLRHWGRDCRLRRPEPISLVSLGCPTARSVQCNALVLPAVVSRL